MSGKMAHKILDNIIKDCEGPFSVNQEVRPTVFFTVFPEGSIQRIY